MTEHQQEGDKAADNAELAMDATASSPSPILPESTTDESTNAKKASSAPSTEKIKERGGFEEKDAPQGGHESFSEDLVHLNGPFRTSTTLYHAKKEVQSSDAAPPPREPDATQSPPLSSQTTDLPPSTSSSIPTPSEAPSFHDDQWKVMTGARHVVFSGGGAKAIACWCAFNGICDIIQQCCGGLELFENIKTFAGTSMGAIISLCAVASDARARVTDIITRPSFWDGYDCAQAFNVENIVKHKAMCNHSLSYGIIDKIMSELGLPETIDFEQLRRLTGKDLICNAANITTEKSQVFSRETTPNMRVRDAVVCSMNVPVILPPIQRYENWYVDGGIYKNLLNDVTPERETIGFFLDWDPIQSAGWARLNFIQYHLSLIASCMNAHQRLLLDGMSAEQKKRFVPVRISLPAAVGSLLMSASPSEIQQLALDGSKAALSFMLAERAFEIVLNDSKMWDEFIDRIPKAGLPTLSNIIGQKGGDGEKEEHPRVQRPAREDSLSPQHQGSSQPPPHHHHQQHQLEHEQPPPSFPHQKSQAQPHPVVYPQPTYVNHPYAHSHHPARHTPIFVPVYYPPPTPAPYYHPTPPSAAPVTYIPPSESYHYPHLHTLPIPFYHASAPRTPVISPPSHHITTTTTTEAHVRPPSPAKNQIFAEEKNGSNFRQPPPHPVVASEPNDDRDESEEEEENKPNEYTFGVRRRGGYNDTGGNNFHYRNNRNAVDAEPETTARYNRRGVNGGRVGLNVNGDNNSFARRNFRRNRAADSDDSTSTSSSSEKEDRNTYNAYHDLNPQHRDNNQAQQHHLLRRRRERPALNDFR